MAILIDESGTHRLSGYSVIALPCIEYGDALMGLSQLTFTVRLAQVTNPVKLDKVLEEVLPYPISERTIERLYIDGKKPKTYERAIKKVLRDKGITVKKLKTVNDQSYTGIRLQMALLERYDTTWITPIKKPKNYTEHLSPILSLSTSRKRRSSQKRKRHPKRAASCAGSLAAFPSEEFVPSSLLCFYYTPAQ